MILKTPSQYSDQGLTESFTNPYVGLRLSSLSRPELTEWLNLALASERCSTVLFVDSQARTCLSDDPQCRVELGRADLLLPCSYGVRAEVKIINSYDFPDIPADDFYRACKPNCVTAHD